MLVMLEITVIEILCLDIECSLVVFLLLGGPRSRMLFEDLVER